MRNRRVLVWDAPNIDMSISQLVGGKPRPSQRPDLRALGRWFVDGGGPDTVSEAAVFVNVPEHLAERLRQWVIWLTSAGYAVFAKPKSEDSDIDEDMVRYLTADIPTADLAEVVVASHDANNFLQPLEALTRDGVGVTLIGFAEFAGRLFHSPLLRFVDFDRIPGLFAVPLPRVDLVGLPPEGRWFPARGVLGAAEDTPPPDGELVAPELQSTG
ncbi:MAG: NYN domain-containing protein [Actinomycetota bacterium]|nr:NYN domain-containing protein [Actinomycetota bacterium]